VVATTRLELRANGPFIIDGHYQWDALSAASGIPVSTLLAETALMSRGAVAQEHRRLGLQRSLVDASARVALARDQKILVAIFLDAHGHGAESGYPEKLGFVRYAPVDASGLAGSLCWKDLRPIARFAV
jgi:hypothetical protein